MSETKSSPTAGPTTGGLDAAAWKVIGVVMLAPFMTQMDSTIVNVSLSSIRHDLHASISSAQWIISGYLLALALMLPLNGWLVDRFGTKKLYIACFTSFTLASYLCGAARTIDELIMARAIQGIAGGLLAPLTQLMVARIAGQHMARVIGYASAPVLLAPLLGPVLAGLILKYEGWPWLFYVNLPVGLLAVTLAFFVIPRDESAAKKRPFDLIGFFLLSPGLVLLLFGFEQASHHEGYSALVTGALFIVSFILHAKLRPDKSRSLIDLDLFKNSVFTIATITQFLSNGIIYAGQFLVPLYLTIGCGLSATEAGWLLMPMGLGMLCVYPLMGYFTERYGCRTVATVGVVVNLLGTLPFLFMAHGGFSIPLAVIGLFARGLGQGATGIPSLAAAYAAVPKERLPFATTAMNIVQRLGGPIMTTSLAIVVSLSGAAHESSGATHDFFIPFLALVLFQLLVFGSAIRLPNQLQRQ